MVLLHSFFGIGKDPFLHGAKDRQLRCVKMFFTAGFSMHKGPDPVNTPLHPFLDQYVISRRHMGPRGPRKQPHFLRREHPFVFLDALPAGIGKVIQFLPHIAGVHAQMVILL